MSKIAKRNYVKKNMDKLHRPKREESRKIYNRKDKAFQNKKHKYLQELAG